MKSHIPIKFSIIFVFIILVFSFSVSCKNAQQRLEDERLSMLYHNAGVNYFSNNNYENAVQNFGNAVKYDKANAYYLNDLALTYSMLGEYDKAIQYYKKALSIKPEAPEIRNGLASVLAIQGNLADAIVEWGKVIKDPLYKSPGIAYFNLGNACFLLNDVKNAEINFTEVLKYNPQHVESLYFLGIIYDRYGRLEESSRYYERSIASNPDFAPSHFNLGVNYFLRNLYDEAEAEFKWIIYSGNDEGLKIKARKYIDKIDIAPGRR